MLLRGATKVPPLHFLAIEGSEVSQIDEKVTRKDRLEPKFMNKIILHVLVIRSIDRTPKFDEHDKNFN